MSNFKQNLVVEGYNETIRILNLQKKFRKGEIMPLDMTEGDIDKINDLYRKQIQELEVQVEFEKQKLEGLKNNTAM